MKNKIVLLFTVFFASLTSIVAQESKTIKPKHSIGKVVMVDKKTYTYYALSSKEKTEIVVEGPGKLEVFLRARLIDTTKSSLPYTVRYIFDDTKAHLDSIPSEKVSKGLHYKTKLEGKPSKASKLYIDVPPGKHIVKFYKGETEEKIAAEFNFKKDANQPEWTRTYPVNKLDTVRIKYLNEKQEIKSYHRISSEQKYTLESKDSMQLKIIIKAELTNSDQSGSPLLIDVKENGKVVKSFKIKGEKSQKTEYVDEKKLIPGNSEVIYLNIPKGNHSYEFSINNKKKTALILIYKNNKLAIKNTKEVKK